MALSNTAVPRYYGMFRDAVLRTERTVYDTSIPAISSSKTTQRGLDYTEQLLLGYNEYPLARR